MELASFMFAPLPVLALLVVVASSQLARLSLLKAAIAKHPDSFFAEKERR
jgi:hypothetical protein